MAKITAKQQAFIREYLLSNNATEAARKAGYKGNDLTLAVIGSENLMKPYIKEMVEKEQAKTEVKLEEQFQVTQEMILTELASIAFANSGDVFHLDDPTNIRMKTDKEMGKRGLTYIDSIKIEREQILEPKKKKRKGDPDPEALVIPAQPKFAITDLKITTLGKEKVKALELLGKQIGMFDGRTGNDKDSRKATLARLQTFFQKNRKSGSGGGS